MQDTKQIPIVHYVLNLSDSIQSINNNASKPAENSNFYIGGILALTSEVIRQNNIQAVLTVMSDKQKRKMKMQKKIEEIDQIGSHFTVMYEDEHLQLSPYFESAISYIQGSLANKMNILVHCKTGKSKSPTIAIAFLIKKYKISFDQAFQIIKKRNQNIQIQQSLLEQLKKNEQKLRSMK